MWLQYASIHIHPPIVGVTSMGQFSYPPPWALMWPQYASFHIHPLCFDVTSIRQVFYIYPLCVGVTSIRQFSYPFPRLWCDFNTPVFISIPRALVWLQYASFHIHPLCFGVTSVAKNMEWIWWQRMGWVGALDVDVRRTERTSLAETEDTVDLPSVDISSQGNWIRPQTFQGVLKNPW